MLVFLRLNLMYFNAEFPLSTVTVVPGIIISNCRKLEMLNEKLLATCTSVSQRNLGRGGEQVLHRCVHNFNS